MDYLAPILVIMIVTAITVPLAIRGLERRNNILSMVLVALLLRLILAIIFYSLPETRLFHEDANGYEALGLWIASSWRGEVPPFHFNKFNYGYFYWNAILYYVFGAYRLHATFFNALTSCLTGIVLYRLARKIFIEAIARRVLMLVLFFPSFILWSAVAIKDPLMMFLLSLIMLWAVELKRSITVQNVVLIAMALIAVFTIRFYMLYVTGAALVMSMMLFRGKSGSGKALVNQLILVGLVAAALMVLGLNQEAQKNAELLTFERIAIVRTNMATAAHSGWGADVDVSTPGKALAYMPLGIAFLLFSPFPWQFTSLRPILTLPEMILWWGMTFAWLRGMKYAWQKRKAELAPALVFTVVLTIAYSPVQGNAGTAFRERAQIMIFLFLFAAVGHYLKKAKAAGLPPQAIEASWRPPEPAAEPARKPLALRRRPV